MTLFSKTFAVIFAIAVGFMACARGETVTAEPDAFLEYIEATGSQYIDTDVNAGPVISNEPTLITTREGLAAIANDLGGSYALGADIDLGGADWTPIGNDSEPFTGTLRGNNHAIRNLACTNSLSGADYRGLFGCASNATIESVSVSGTVAGKQYVGGFVGYVEDSPTFSECFACGSVTATGDNVGGFVGELYDTPSLTDCYALVDAKGASYVGGFVGQIYYYDGVVTRCYSAGSASGSG